jgi:hypothetical protein
LYDIISIHSIDNGDNNEQIQIYDSFPWKIKNYFKDIIKFTIQYTNEMSQKYDINKISLEQQVYLLKVDDIVKEKAMVKLKEVKTQLQRDYNDPAIVSEDMVSFYLGLSKLEHEVKAK